MTKRRSLFLFCIIALAILASCNNEPPHVCEYNSVTLACSCGKVSDDAIAYVGTSFDRAAARFSTLQKAADYVKTKQSTKAAKTTVNGRPNATIVCDGLSIENSSVKFNLSTNRVTFSQNAIISIEDSDASINIGTVTGEGIPIKVSSGTLDLAADISCGVELSESSSIKLSGSNVTIESFTSDSASEITLDVETVSISNYADVSKINSVLTESSSSNITVEGHTHSYDSVTKQCACSDIESSVVAYIGDSFKDSNAKRFNSLQDAVDYVETQKTSLTIHGRSGKVFSDSSIAISNCNVVLDFSNCTVNPSIGFNLTDSKVSLILDSALTIGSFSSDDKSTFKVTASSTTVLNLSDYLELKSVLSTDSSPSLANTVIKGHTHSFVAKYSEEEQWEECETCGYCTAKEPIEKKWVSIFYLDMADLTALVDIEEIITNVKTPTNVTMYIVTGGGYDRGLLLNSEYYNPYCNLGTTYPNLVKALENGGDKWHTIDFEKSMESDQYQYWKYYLDSNGKGSFIELKHTPVQQTKLISDGWVMEDFIDYVYSMEGAQANKRYLLHLWNHGGGNMQGMMQDMTVSSFPLMSMDDMNDNVKATDFVKSGHKFEIILFDMCLMQQIETLNMVKYYSLCMVGSENVSMASHLGGLYYYMNEYPNESYINTAKYFINKTNSKQANRGFRTWSVLDLAGANNANSDVYKLNEAFEDFLEVLVLAEKSDITEALSKSADYSAMSSSNTCSYDIYDVALQFGYSEPKLSELKTAIEKVVEYEIHGDDVAGSTGLAFYLDINLGANLKKSAYYRSCYQDYIDRAKDLYPSLVTLTNMFL